MGNQIRRADLADLDFLDADELQSSGTTVYLTADVVSTDAGTKTVVIMLPADGEGIQRGEHPAELGDLVVITGTGGGLGDGTFTIASVGTSTSCVVAETIGTSSGGTAVFRYASGASRIGLDPTNLAYTAATTVQAALEAVPFIPPPVQVGDLLTSLDGATFAMVHPIVSLDGWLANNDAELLIEGLEP